ncbi:MAG TPA: sigma-70 family RNA polymerase sigma factor [Planctomycetota bacterium]|nr:sigma-70 family RNA polymerase sigma factor [Planctomycetota bacterium]
MPDPKAGPPKSEILSTQTDEALMARVGRGQADAFEILVDRHTNSVTTFCYAFCRDRDQAEDLMQEVFMRVYRNARSYKPVAKFTTWLYRVAANLCINEAKKAKLRKMVSLDGPMDADPDATRIVEKMATDDPGPITEAERREASRLIERAIEALPRDQRVTLILVERQNLPYKDVAEILGDVTVSAVKMRVKRARENLREALRFLEAAKGGG